MAIDSVTMDEPEKDSRTFAHAIDIKGNINKKPLTIALTVKIGDTEYGDGVDFGTTYTHEDIRRYVAGLNGAIKTALLLEGIKDEDLGDGYKLLTDRA